MPGKTQLIDKNGAIIGYADDTTVVEDGCGVRVSTYLIDGVPTESVRLVDSAGRPAGSRPGFVFDASHDERAAVIAYDAMVARQQQAWRGSNVAVTDAATDPEVARANMIARSQNAWRNTPVKDSNLQTFAELRIPDDDPETDPETARANARANMIRRSESAWKSPGGVGLPGPYNNGR